jgi:sugar phosphate isomerase/epimerase
VQRFTQKKSKLIPMKSQFKLGLNIDNVAMKPPLELAPGWDTAEIPITELLLPFSSDEVWEAKLAEIRTWNQPPWAATSHWLWDERVTGDNATDFAELERQAEQTCRRMAQIGCPVAGVWGNFFPIGSWSKTKAVDYALKYCDMVAGYAEKYGILIALEPTANPDTIFPTYRDGIDFVRLLDRKPIRLMADLNYFIAINQPFEDIAIEPGFCLHVHIQGETYQPNVGDCDDKILHIFRVLRDIGYLRTVSSAHPWISTLGGDFDYRKESALTLEYLQKLRGQVYSE